MRESGIDFTYYGNPSPEHYMTEQNGGGVAISDFDGDGWPDVFLVNGSHFDRPAEEAGATHRLFRNAGAASSARFEDITAGCGLGISGFGMGCSAGDVDNDGFVDLVICEFGAIRLWKNQGDGTFEDVSRSAGLVDLSWCAGAALADLDDDGDLDLYVVNYIDYNPAHGACLSPHTPPVRISCGPIGLVGQTDRLWENRGDGTFVDDSQASGIAVEAGKGLAVEIADLDGDGRLDIFVANDTTPNLLFQNLGGLKFEEVGRFRGVAVGDDGQAPSGMGIACADFDGNGRLDLFVTNFENAANVLYDNRFESTFLNRTMAAGLDGPSRPMLAFGTVAADYDLDGRPDLFVANGHIWDLRSTGGGHLFEMPPQLFRNSNGRRFDDVSLSAGTYFQSRWLGRAAAMADLNLDGASDLVVSQQLAPTAVLVNESPKQGRSLVVRFVGREAARQPLGARVVARVGEQTATMHVPAGGSFASSHDAAVIVSTGHAEAVDELTIHWRENQPQTWRKLPAAGRVLLIERRETPQIEN